MPLEIPQTAMDILRRFNSDDAAAKEAYGLTPGEDSPRAAPWPDPLRPEAFHGVAGELVRKIEPHSEADPAALLTHVLVSFGNAVGRGPHFRVGGAEHHANLYCVNVGATASRKGTAKEDVLFVIRQADPDWVEERIQSGLSSGEGFIWAVRDPIEEQQPVKEKGRVVDYQHVVTDPGVKDKRLLVIEPEFGSTLRVLEREGNTLSAQLRQAWDSGNLRVLTKNKAAKATGAHISLLAHITREELLKYLNQTEQANGYANRHLWVCVRRSKFLPDGGNLHALDLSGITAQLRDAVQFARTVCEVRRSEAARAIWHAVYPALAGDRTGLGRCHYRPCRGPSYALGAGVRLDGQILPDRAGAPEGGAGGLAVLRGFGAVHFRCGAGRSHCRQDSGGAKAAPRRNDPDGSHSPFRAQQILD